MNCCPERSKKRPAKWAGDAIKVHEKNDGKNMPKIEQLSTTQIVGANNMCHMVDHMEWMRFRTVQFAVKSFHALSALMAPLAANCAATRRAT